MRKFIRKQLIRIIKKIVNTTYARQLILFVYQIYGKTLIEPELKLLNNHRHSIQGLEKLLNNYGHAIRGVEKALYRHEMALNNIQSQLEQFLVSNKKNLAVDCTAFFSETMPAFSSNPVPSSIKISLVINTYNRIKSLRSTLNSLNYLRYPHLEVVVVDGPSTDGTFNYLQTVWSDKVKIYTCDVANLATSRNIGIAQAAGDIICFIDDDAVPEADWLDELALAYQDNKVAAVGGWVRDQTGVNFQVCDLIFDRTGISQKVKISNREHIKTCDSNGNFFGVIGVNCSFRRSALLEIKGFDEEYAYFLDETDVVIRLLDAGYELRIVPTAEVHHSLASNDIRKHPDNIKSLAKITRSITYFCIKNADPTTSIRRCMEIIEERKEQLFHDMHYRLATNRIDPSDSERLMAEVSQFSRQGIIDAFAFPCRQLLKGPSSQAQWKDFSRLLDSSQRLRLAFILKEYSSNTINEIERFTYHLAKSLAAAGHEITVITQTEASNQHTVSFEDNLWIHRLPNNISMAEIVPQNRPLNIPDIFYYTTRQVLAELDRINDRRQIHYVIGSNWNLSLMATVASHRYSVVLYLSEDSATGEEILDYEKFKAQITDAEAQVLDQADHVLAYSKTVYRKIAFKLNSCLDKKGITLCSIVCYQTAVKKIESILYKLNCIFA
ncbi:glycosyltransferase [Rickettsiella grylli]|nr:glycosyltransferase [Rickettsiella grylli]